MRAVCVILVLGACGCGASTGTSSRDAGALDASTSIDAAVSHACGSSTCGADEICITGRCAGCCDLPPTCIPIPSGCTDELSCACFASDPCGGCTSCQSVTAGEIVCGDCRCTCAALWTQIETPSGPRRIDELRIGDVVWSIDHGQRVAVHVARVNRSAVTRHAMVRVTLIDGGVIEMSGGHPTADGRRFDSLAPGDSLGAARIAAVATVAYDEPFTYDILPSSDTGTYFVGEAAIGSTLSRTSPVTMVAARSRDSAAARPACDRR